VAVLLLLTGLGVSAAAAYFWLEQEFRAARAAAEQRDYERAWSHLAPCLRLRPNSPEGHLLKARLAWRTDRFGEAERELEIAQRLGAARDAVSLERALVRVRKRELTIDLDNYLRDRVNRKHPDTRVILDVLSQTYMEMYRLHDARDCLNV